MAKPKEEHIAVEKRVLRYGKGTLNYGLHYGKDQSQKLRVYTESNYARYLEDRRSTSGYMYVCSMELQYVGVHENKR